MTNISRSETKIMVNTLPKEHMGRWFQTKEAMNLRIKPPYDNDTIMVAVEPILIIADADTGLELYRFQTQTTFQFLSTLSKKSTYLLVYQLICIAIEESNLLLKDADSTLTINKEYSKPSYEEISSEIEAAFAINHISKVNIKPYWKSDKNDFDGKPTNEEIIQGLPVIPEFKNFITERTAEQLAVDNLMRGVGEEDDEIIVRKALEFYNECFSKLKQMNLFVLDETQAEYLKRYLGKVFNFEFVLSNTAEFEVLSRVTIIKDEFLQDGKVKDVKYLRNPPVALNKKNGVYGRVNTPDTTVFYASFYENVALRETKPKVGDRIIVSTWKKLSSAPFIYFPIGLVPGIETEENDKIIQGVESLKEKVNPLIAELLECFLRFLAYEFIKDPTIVNPKKFEYLYSAFFADRILQITEKDSSQFNFDAIIYPSVAWNHAQQNIALKDDSVAKLQLIMAKEIKVDQVFYNKKLDMNEYPIQGRIVRVANKIQGQTILWNDD